MNGTRHDGNRAVAHVGRCETDGSIIQHLARCVVASRARTFTLKRHVTSIKDPFHYASFDDLDSRYVTLQVLKLLKMLPLVNRPSKEEFRQIYLLRKI